MIPLTAAKAISEISYQKTVVSQALQMLLWREHDLSCCLALQLNQLKTCKLKLLR